MYDYVTEIRGSYACIGTRCFRCEDFANFVLYKASSKMPLKIPITYFVTKKTFSQLF